MRGSTANDWWAVRFCGSAKGWRAVLAVTAPIALCSSAHAAKLVTLHDFCTTLENNLCSDGQAPASRLLKIGTKLYGFSTVGGATQESILYAVGTSKTFQSVATFCNESPCPEGMIPGRYLARGAEGNYYGVTTADATADGGTIFRVSPSGQVTTVYQFCSLKRCGDGSGPVSVVVDKHGELFGTTVAGGGYREGTVFRFDASGGLKVLHDFCASTSCPDSNTPGALTLGSDGNIYGVTAAGGAVGAGTVFQITPTGTFNTLYSFCSHNKPVECSDGEEPTPKLAEGPGGDFYGLTSTGGADGEGTVFQITTTGTLKTLYSFCSQTDCDDGEVPADGLVVAADGSFYGVTTGGGNYFNGLVFNITASGTYSVVSDFCRLGGCFDGALPQAAPTLSKNGTLYGTTTAGGDANEGTVYALTP